MKISKIFRAAGAALAGVSLIFAAGCSNLFENIEKDDGGSAVASQAGKAVLSVSVGSGARTILPSGINFDASGLTFTLSGAISGGTSTTLGSWSDTTDAKAYANMAASSVSVDIGSWTFTLSVSNSSGEVLSGTAEKTIEAGTNEISFGTLSESSGTSAAAGNVTLSLSFPAGKVVSAEAVIYPFGKTESDGKSKTLEITKGDSADSVNFAADADAGTYIVKITLYTNEEKTAKTVYTELAVVAPGAESKAERKLKSLNEIFTITYVSNEGKNPETNPVSYTGNEEIKLADATTTSEENAFVGWYESEDFSTSKITGWKAGEKTGNVTLYAKWETAVTADNIVEKIKAMTESGTLKATGTFSTELIREINSALKELASTDGRSKVLVSLDLSEVEGLTKLEEPSSTNSTYSFYGCTNLSGIVLPDKITTIGEGAFSGCSSLTEMTIPFVGASATAEYKESYFGYIFGKSKYDGGTKTADEGWSNCYYIPSTLRKVTVTGENVPSNSFEGCVKLTKIILGSKVTSIGKSAFHNCTSLASITIPDSVTSIGSYAFEGCTALKSITIPDSVTSIEFDAFQRCTSLESVYITSMVAWCNISFENGSSNPLCNGAKLYLNGVLIADLTIPDSVKKIGEYAFYSYKNLTSITIPASVTNIGREAFSGCTSLASVKIIDDGRKLYIHIKDQAFYGCTSLESIALSKMVKTIGYMAFSDCTNLKNAKLYVYGWYLYSSESSYHKNDKPKGQLSSSALSDTSKAAYILTNSQTKYFWYHI